jgi:L-malate glycosyltransferase
MLPYMNLGGTEKQALSLMASLGDRYLVSLLAPTGPGDRPFREASFPYYEFPRLDLEGWTGLKQFCSQLLAIDRDRSIDLIHVHAAHELTFLVKLILPKVPIVFTVHGYHGASSGVSYWLAAAFANLFPHKTIAVSQADVEILTKNRLRAHKLALVYNGVAPPKIDPARAAELSAEFGMAEKFTLVTAARLSPAKGLEYLIQAFTQLSDRYPHLQLIIAGDGELKTSLQAQIDRAHLHDRIILAGYVPDVQNLIAVGDLFVLPSLQEAMPLVCAEAMALKKAIVATDVGGVPEQVEDGHTGLIVPPKDVEALTHSLDTLIMNPQLRTKFAHQGYQRYLDLFTLETMIDRTVKIYES